MVQQKQQGKRSEPALLQAFKKGLNAAFPFVVNDLDRDLKGQRVKRPVLLAISGGMDSMVLGRLLHDAEIPAIWVHCNFHLRGAESDRDEAFVRETAMGLDVPLVVKGFDTKKAAAEWKISIEEAARKLRYDFFRELLDKNKQAWEQQVDQQTKLQTKLPTNQQKQVPCPAPIFLMTAHHGNDQIETLLMNFFRGCGISGLHGIPAKNNWILRPLLAFKRPVLLAYAQSEDIQWVEDSSNQSTDYTRNFLRHKVIGELKSVYPAIEDNLLDNIQRFSQAESLYQMGLAQYKKRLMNFQGGVLHISVLLLKKSGIASTLLWEVLKDYGFSFRQIPEIEKLLTAGSGAYQDNASGTYRVLRNRAHLVVSALDKQTAEVLVIEAGMNGIEFAGGRLEIKNQPGGTINITPDAAVAQVDSRLVAFPLLLRKWKPGDYFYPLGMRKKKKIARFLIDQKVGMHEKAHVWVLESQGRIVWVLGQRMDDRFKITAGTKNILKLKLYGTNDCLK